MSPTQIVTFFVTDRLTLFMTWKREWVFLSCSLSLNHSVNSSLTKEKVALLNGKSPMITWVMERCVKRSSPWSCHLGGTDFSCAVDKRLMWSWLITKNMKYTAGTLHCHGRSEWLSSLFRPCSGDTPPKLYSFNINHSLAVDLKGWCYKWRIRSTPRTRAAVNLNIGGYNAFIVEKSMENTHLCNIVHLSTIHLYTRVPLFVYNPIWQNPVSVCSSCS